MVQTGEVIPYTTSLTETGTDPPHRGSAGIIEEPMNVANLENVGRQQDPRRGQGLDGVDQDKDLMAG